MDGMSVSYLKLRQHVHQPSAHPVPSSPVFWHPIDPDILRYQKLPNLEPSELMRNTGETRCNEKRYEKTLSRNSN